MYEKEQLSYDFNSLEPYISSKGLKIHYTNIYLDHLNKLNKLLEEEKIPMNMSKEQLVKQIDKVSLKNRGEVLYHLGAVLNHEQYFKNMSPKKNNIPVGLLSKKIIEQYGNYNNFKNEFKNKSLDLVGSGYTYLVLNGNRLDIINVSNEENPYFYGFVPIFGIDLFEHAYYLDENTNKEKYIDNFFSVIDFSIIDDTYEKNIQK